MNLFSISGLLLQGNHCKRLFLYTTTYYLNFKLNTIIIGIKLLIVSSVKTCTYYLVINIHTVFMRLITKHICNIKYFLNRVVLTSSVSEHKEYIYIYILINYKKYF